MGNVALYVDEFFEQLEIYEDKTRGHFYKPFLHQAVLAFLENENKETAFDVYRTFFSSYRITMGGEGNPFIDLLDTLKSYEENAATLIKKQRDHYVHSVNVFILGLCIYAKNAQYRAAFDQAVMDKSVYPYSYDTRHEEFFYRWGIASLFHDVGYPVEIIGKQAEQFVNFATDVDGAEEKVRAYLAYHNFGEMNSIAEAADKAVFARPYFAKHKESAGLDPLKPLDLLALKLHVSLGVPLDTMRDTLYRFTDTMAESGFIDHGYFSSIIVLKWYGYLIQKCGYKPEYFFYPVLDSASAILMHNFYRNVFRKAPFDLPPLAASTHPIAYLLILCDELQEWNREAYGFVDKKRTLAGEAALRIGDTFSVTYLTKKGSLAEGFAKEKEELLHFLLDLSPVFPEGFYIGCESVEALQGLTGRLRAETSTLPRPLLQNLERLAIAIHEKYNEAQLQSHPEEPLAYPHFSDLPDDLKYSNLRQAQSIVDKLSHLGMYMMPKNWSGARVQVIPEERVDALAKKEHDDWMRERLENGWQYGPEKDVQNRISPYLIPYEELSEEIKEKDRNAVRNIPALLDGIGMAAYMLK